MNIITESLYKIPDDKKACVIIDADWHDKYGLILVTKEKNKYRVVINGTPIEASFSIHYPLVRWVDNSQFILVDTRCKGKQHNAFIHYINGTLITSFHCGDAISDVQVNKEGMWVGYFDEGVYGDGISTEGLVFFSLKGNLLKRYYSDLEEDKPGIDDCYALCRGKGSSVWMYAYGDFELTHWDHINNQLKSYQVPDVCEGSKAICVRGNYAYFHARYSRPDNLYAWEIGKKKAGLIGKVKGELRGLSPRERNHFINVDEKEVSVFYIENENETYS